MKNTLFRFMPAAIKSHRILAASFVIAVIWQLLMTGFGFIADVSTAHVFKQNPDMAQSAVIHTGLLDHTNHWDSAWYLSIIHGAYTTRDASPVFYPLYPVIIGAVYYLTGTVISPLVIALVLNTLFLTAAIFFLRRISDYYVPKKYAWWPIAIFITSPAAIFLHMFYTEALFCAIAFGAFFFAKRRNWLACGLLLGLATSARVPSLLIIGLCGLEYLRAHQWSVLSSLRDKSWFSFLIAPIGFVIYGTYLALVRGDFFAMFHNYALWSYQRFDLNIFRTLYHGVKYLAGAAGASLPFDTIAVVNFLLPLLGLTALLLASWYAFYKLKDIPLALFGIASLVFFSLNSNSVSVHRYLLPTLVIYLVAGHLAATSHRWKYAMIALIYLMTLTQAFLILLFVNDFFAG